MNGIVSTLDKTNADQVKALWEGLHQEFGVGNPSVYFAPHFSYHIAEKYQDAALRPILAEAATKTAVFEVIATGIGLFNGREPVVYVPVSRNRPLLELQEAVWTAVDPLSEGSSAYYHPLSWFPHITLGHGDILPHQLGGIVQWLNEQSLVWTIRVSRLEFVKSWGNRSRVMYHERFKGK